MQPVVEGVQPQGRGSWRPWAGGAPGGTHLTEQGQSLFLLLLVFGLTGWHMEVAQSGIKTELQLQQCQILNPLHRVWDRTQVAAESKLDP